ncbi:MAG: ABC transporter substrate-binding protein, partial [Ruminococcus sp.]
LDLLEQNGLKPTTEGGNVTISAVANADVANTMERGDIDAALVPEPWGATLLSQGAELVLDYDEVFLEGKYDVAVVVVRKEFLENNPDLVEKFLDAHNLATERINNDTEASLEIINKELDEATGKSLGESIIKEAFSRIGVSTEINKDSISKFATISKEQEFIKEIPEDDALYAKQ